MITTRTDWPNFTWDVARLASILPELRYQQGRLTGRMEALSPALQRDATHRILSHEWHSSAQITGENLDPIGLQSMLADAALSVPAALTEERLLAWHAAVYHPENFLNDAHTCAEVARFLKWLNAPSRTDSMIKAAVAHLWFLALQPFTTGNGLLARNINDLLFARVDKNQQCTYAMSGQLLQERDTYHALLENCLQGSLEITAWIEWFLQCCRRAVLASKESLQPVIFKARFWETCRGAIFNERQIQLLDWLLEGDGEQFSSSTWAARASCSQDSALRDITDLVTRRLLKKADGGGRSTLYQLVMNERISLF